MTNLTIEKMSEKIFFGRLGVNRGVVMVSMLLLLGALALLPLQLDRMLLDYTMPAAPKPLLALENQEEEVQTAPLPVDPSDEIIAQMQSLDLWNIEPDNQIRPVLFSEFPENIEYISDVSLRKKVFFHTLLPVALVAQKEVKSERRQLAAIIDKTAIDPSELWFNDLETMSYASWRSNLDAQEIAFIERIAEKYRSRHAEVLLRRVDVLPMSLILAQGAIESSWGGSRFAREGNNIFGLWTWDGNGMTPKRREEDKTHKIRAYDTILDSVRGYLLTLNRLPAYEKLRDIRLESRNPLDLAEGLLSYSERRNQYIEDVREMIIMNDLMMYDQVSLAMSQQIQPRLLQSASYAIQ